MDEINFDEIYNELYNECLNELKYAKKIAYKFLILLIVLCIIFNIVVFAFANTRVYLTGSLCLSFALIMLFSINARRNYSRVYKEVVIGKLVRRYNEDLHFDQNVGITRLDFKSSGFNSEFDRYFSEDRVYGRLKNGGTIQLAEVVLFKKYPNEQEKEDEIWRGLYGIARLEKNILCKVVIDEDSAFNRFSKDRIEVDSAEFEKYFDCSSDDKIIAMRIFDSELIETYIKIMQRYNYKLTLKIENDKIYFKYKCGSLFEAPTLGLGLDKDIVRKYFEMIYYPMEIIENTVKNISEL